MVWGIALEEQDLFGLAGKSAVIVGGGLGIGRASAEILARVGAAIAVVDVDPERARAVATNIEERGGRALSVVADVLDPVQGSGAIEEAASGLGGLDILVNVVGRSRYSPILDLSEDSFTEDLARNMGYVFRGCKTFAGLLDRSGRDGVIVNIASVAGLLGAPGNAGYGAAKAALISLTRSMAVEWAPRGVRVNCVAPGIIATDHWLASRGEGAAAEAERRSAAIPMGRLGDQWEVAKAVLFLASDLSSYVTGETLVLDGGRMVRPSVT
jgi:NAD(P)-dependent dehydrogenase (short-subunit alcohol dehydrogenase family)